MMASGLSAVIAELALSEALWRIVWLRDYNTRIVLLGTVLLGLAAGQLGVYLLLRRRVLIGDAISHATLPGVAIAFLWSVSLGQEKSLGLLLFGAAVSGSLGGMAVLFLRHAAKIREDAALGIVLSVFFGAGVVLLSIAQQSGGNAAGLESFIYGKAAAMTSEDVWLCGSGSRSVPDHGTARQGIANSLFRFRAGAQPRLAGTPARCSTDWPSRGGDRWGYKPSG
ncbi:MAG: metal ABC transporter permease [Pirellulaceae bacterium]